MDTLERVPRGVLVLLLAVAVPIAVGAPAHADKCAGAKREAVGKKEAGLLACQSKVAAKNDSAGLTACQGNIMSKFATAFAKAGTCPVDQIRCEEITDAWESAVAMLATDTFPSKCDSSKRKAAGKLAHAELGCYAKAARSGALDAACITRAQGKFRGRAREGGRVPGRRLGAERGREPLCRPGCVE